MSRLGSEVAALEHECSLLRVQRDAMWEELRNAKAAISAKPVYMRIHVVAEGDTLSDICQHYYRVTGMRAFNVQEIAMLNHISNPDRIQTGQHLMLPYTKTTAVAP